MTTATLETESTRSITPHSANADGPATAGRAPTEPAPTARAARINLPLNLEKWAHLPKEQVEDLTWLHAYIIENRLSWKYVEQSLNYDTSTISRVFAGVYTGNWESFCQSIRVHRKLVEGRALIQTNQFVENVVWSRISAGLDYAYANRSITTITGESRMGKTECLKEWKRRNNHGRCALVTAPVFGGPKALLQEIAGVVGIGIANKSIFSLHQSILKAFNENRILIIDEAHRVLPDTGYGSSTKIEILRDIHDRCNCALAFASTARFTDDLRKGEYMFEQIIGRIGMPIRLPRKLGPDAYLPIVHQYVSRPNAALQDVCQQIANAPGRLGILVELLKVGSKIAKKRTEKLSDEHVFRAIKLTEEMQGEKIFAK